MTTAQQIQWDRQDNNSVRTTLTLACNPDGSVHMSQGEFEETYSNPQAATQGLITLFEQGTQQARANV